MTMDHLAEARRLLEELAEWSLEGSSDDFVIRAIRHLADAIEELRPALLQLDPTIAGSHAALAQAVRSVASGDGFAVEVMGVKIAKCAPDGTTFAERQAQQPAEVVPAPGPAEQLYECTQPTCGCRQDDRYKPLPEPRYEYSRCPRCGTEHTDRPGKLCYHCGLEPPGEPETVPDPATPWCPHSRSTCAQDCQCTGEPETVPALLPEHTGRRWRDRGNYVWTFEANHWVVRDGRDQISGIYRPGDGNAKFGPFTAVEEA